MTQEVFALSLRAEDSDGTLSGEITDVTSFVLNNLDEPDMVIAALDTVQNGEVYHGGGGAQPSFTIRAISDEDVLEYLKMKLGEKKL